MHRHAFSVAGTGGANATDFRNVMTNRIRSSPSSLLARLGPAERGAGGEGLSYIWAAPLLWAGLASRPPGIGRDGRGAPSRSTLSGSLASSLELLSPLVASARHRTQSLLSSLGKIGGLGAKRPLGTIRIYTPLPLPVLGGVSILFSRRAAGYLRKSGCFFAIFSRLRHNVSAAPEIVFFGA